MTEYTTINKDGVLKETRRNQAADLLLAAIQAELEVVQIGKAAKKFRGLSAEAASAKIRAQEQRAKADAFAKFAETSEKEIQSRLAQALTAGLQSFESQHLGLVDRIENADLYGLKDTEVVSLEQQRYIVECGMEAIQQKLLEWSK